jgi:hypothetical protein
METQDEHGHVDHRLSLHGIVGHEHRRREHSRSGGIKRPTRANFLLEDSALGDRHAVDFALRLIVVE